MITRAVDSETIQQRLEYLRSELRAERISYGELGELQTLAEYIHPGDVELLEAAGVREGAQHYSRTECEDCGHPLRDSDETHYPGCPQIFVGM